MKGVKKKCYGLLLVFCTIFGLLSSVFLGNSAFAASVTTYYWFFANTGQSEQWSSAWSGFGGPYTSSLRLQLGPSASIRYIRFNTDNVTTGGNYASIHFEANVVTAYPLNYDKRWSYDPSVLGVTSINFAGNPVSIVSSSVSTSITNWEEWNGSAYCTQSNPCNMSTLTIYGDATVSGINSGATGSYQVTVGNSTAPFWYSNSTQNIASSVYLEQNPITITYSNNIDNALLNTQINQNNTIIQQNQAQIEATYEGTRATYENTRATYRTNDLLEEQSEQDQEDRDNMSDASDDAEAGATASQDAAESTGTTLLAAFTAFVGALTNASPTNCNIDMDLGNLDLGVVNLCRLSPPAGFQTITSIFMILFCVPLSIATARKVISLFRSFQT